MDGEYDASGYRGPLGGLDGASDVAPMLAIAAFSAALVAATGPSFEQALSEMASTTPIELHRHIDFNLTLP
jgi:hypothetical protein